MTTSGTTLFAAALFTAFLTGALRGDDDRPAQSHAAGSEDGAAQLPRFPLKDAAESQRAITVRPGFRVELVAAEPLLRSPVAIDFDEDGRLYVAEFPEYNQYANPKPSGRGCVRLLEDTDGDGVYDKSTLFADDVPMATAVACWDGGVYVGSAPDLLYLKDTNGDGKADVRRVVFTGFGKDRAGEGMLNSFRWGLDNRFHISTSLDGGLVRPADRPGGKDGVGPRPRLPLRPARRDVRADRRRRAARHEHGRLGPDLRLRQQRPVPARDVRQPLPRPQPLPPGAPGRGEHRPGRQVYQAAPRQPRRAVAALRTRLRSQGLVPGSDEGGSPSGFFTGGTGVTVYRGDAFPPEFHGNLFVGDVANNVIHRALAVPSGVLVTAQSAEAGREFLASRDTYFRPVQMANGPDGCLWVVDMYRELIEGAAFLPPQILKHMDVASGVDRGRIWRVVPAGHKPKIPRLSKATTAELVALLEHPNGWHRDTASRLLYQRQDRSAVAPLRQLAAASKTPLGRTHALYALAGLGALRAGRCACRPERPGAARSRTRPCDWRSRFCQEVERVQQRMEEMVGDTDPLVRYQLAFSLGALPGTKPAAALAALAVRDGADPWMRVAILSSDGRLHRRGLSPAGRQRRIPLLAARPSILDRAGGPDRRRRPARRPGRGPQGAGWPAGRG